MRARSGVIETLLPPWRIARRGCEIKMRWKETLAGEKELWVQAKWKVPLCYVFYFLEETNPWSQLTTAQLSRSWSSTLWHVAFPVNLFDESLTLRVILPSTCQIILLRAAAPIMLQILIITIFNLNKIIILFKIS